MKRWLYAGTTGYPATEYRPGDRAATSDSLRVMRLISREDLLIWQLIAECRVNERLDNVEKG